MRIEGSNRSGSVSNRGALSKAGAGAVFAPTGQGGVGRIKQAPPASAVMGVGSILALQGIGDVNEGRRRAVKRGAALLDLLEGMKADLLLGDVSPSRLDAMSQQLSTLRDKVDPDLDAVLDEIELRVLVELAKSGRFPTL
ncbi:flagellar assembly protein FliX [Devosia sp. MC1541]|uniref:flagellar assembly protein FliX n=1 Tax=Devosia sp. MC1541 TaxID=2725264 RepID=UPI0024A69A66|nr:flagellar assembly protein FliX [Devosia sp. MC1541]